MQFAMTTLLAVATFAFTQGTFAAANNIPANIAAIEAREASDTTSMHSTRTSDSASHHATSTDSARATEKTSHHTTSTSHLSSESATRSATTSASRSTGAADQIQAGGALVFGLIGAAALL